jgi:hypothetical protein
MSVYDTLCARVHVCVCVCACMQLFECVYACVRVHHALRHTKELHNSSKGILVNLNVEMIN